MTFPRTIRLIGLAPTLLLATLPIVTQAQPAAETITSTPIASTTVPVYKPPLRGAPATRIGGASRGVSNNDLVLSVLAPESTGLTSRAQPTLYWYTSKTLSTPLEFTLNDEQSIKPLVELQVPAAQPGIHALKLKYTLKPEVEYSWTLAAIADPDQRASDILTGGAIQYAPPPATLVTQLKNASPQQQVFLYAQEGFWYDALATLSEQIAAHPLDHSLREQRAALLEQVGLSAAAQMERANAKPVAAP